MNKRLSKTFGIFFLVLELAIVPKAIDLMLNQHFSELAPSRIIGLAMTFGSIALCIIMSYSSMSEHDSYPLHTFLFEIMVFLCCIAPMTEFMTKALESMGRPKLNMLVNTVYYLIGISIAFVIMLYEFLIIGANKKPRIKKVRKAASALMILDGLATILNIKFGYFFTITDSGTYQSAPTFWTAYIAPAIIVAIIVIIASFEMPSGKQKNAFIFFWIFAMLFTFVQLSNPDLSVQYTGYTLSIIVIYINIQSELDTACLTQ